MEVLNLTHYHNVFNSHHPTDPTVLEDVQQRHIIWELNDHITWDEFQQAVKKLKNEKAAGLTGVPAEAFKAMCNANLLHIHKHANDFFVGTADHKQWHRSQCVPLPKSGDLSNRNKWRGIVLMDVLSHEQNQNRHQIPIWRHARTRLPRWLIRTQNNAQPTKKSQSAVPHGIVADLVNAYNIQPTT